MPRQADPETWRPCLPCTCDVREDVAALSDVGHSPAALTALAALTTERICRSRSQRTLLWILHHVKGTTANERIPHFISHERP